MPTLEETLRDPEFAKLSPEAKRIVLQQVGGGRISTPQTQSQPQQTPSALDRLRSSLPSLSGLEAIRNPGGAALLGGLREGMPGAIKSLEQNLEAAPLVGAVAGSPLGPLGAGVAAAGGEAFKGLGEATLGKVFPEYQPPASVPSTGLGVLQQSTLEGLKQGLLQKGGELVAGPGAKAIADRVMPLIKGLAPRASRFAFRESAIQALPEIDKTVAQTGEKITNVESLLNAVKTTKDRIWSGYSKLIGDNADLTFDGNKVADAMMEAIPKNAQIENPALVKSIANQVDNYRRPITLEEAEQLRLEASAELKSFFNRFSSERAAAIRSDPTIAVRAAQGQALNSGIEEILQKQGGQSGQQIRQLYGSLAEVGNAAERRLLQAQAAKPLSLYEGFGRIYGVSRILRGAIRAITGDVGGGAATIAEGGSEVALGAAAAKSRAIDTLVGKAFAEPSAVRETTGAALPQVIRALSASSKGKTNEKRFGATLQERLASQGVTLK